MGIPIQGGFADVEETIFEALPSGRYHVAVFSGEMRQAGPEAKHPGADYIAWEFNVLEEDYEKRKLWHNTSLVPEARGLLKHFLKGVGYTDEELNNPDFELDPNDIIGRETIAVVRKGKNPKTNEDNNSIRKFIPLGSDESGVVEDTDLPE